MSKTGYYIFIHFLGWLFFIILVAAFLKNGGAVSQSWLGIIFSMSFLLFVLFYGFVFYLNQYVLIPQLFLKRNYVSFSIIAIGLLVAVFYIKPFDQAMQDTRQFNNASSLPPPNRGDGNRKPPPSEFGDRPLFQDGERQPPKGQRQRIDIISLVLYFMALTGSAMIVLSKQWRLAEKNKALVEVQKANAELAFLKAQISPHFLFNVLNNIYALVMTKNENAASSILRLSNIMRYVTDDARVDYVPIEKEIACINDFIALQKLRLSKKVTLNYSVQGEYKQVIVAPLILMAFVENAFKHGVSNNIAASIKIEINVNELTINLITQNTILDKNSSEDRIGVGLQNVTQRLALLYPDNRYQLHINTENNIFEVVLVLHNAKTS